MRHCALRLFALALASSSPPRFDPDIRRWLRAPDVVIAGKTWERS
jgi:hypothetical protein